MRVLIFHGYMLRGTGSNIYNVNLARALARLGHEVHLLCQDREVRIEGVEIHNPDIHGLLPVYVKDPYEGFEVKAFPELSEAELDRYIEANVAAVREVADAVGGLDAALANHLVMGPAILARAEIGPFAAKIHGSALEYTVKPHPRFLPYAYEGMKAASGVLVGSAHTAESLWAALPELPDLKEKTRLGPPGVDVEEFCQLEPADNKPGPWEPDSGTPRTKTSPAGVPEAGSRERPGSRQPLVAFVGKLIVSKGVDLLLAAWPLVHAAHPDARLEVAGLRRVRAGAAAACLRRSNAATSTTPARWRVSAGRSRVGRSGRCRSSRPFSPTRRRAMRRQLAPMAGSVELIGRLEHDAGGDLAAAGRGAGDAEHLPGGVRDGRGRGRRLRGPAGLGRALGHARGLAPARRGAACQRSVGLTSFPVEPGAVEAIADRLNDWLALPPERREAARAGPGRDGRQAVELGGSGPRGARRGGRRAGRSAASCLASAKRHLGRKTSRRRFNRMPAA